MAKQVPVVNNCCRFRPLKRTGRGRETEDPYLAEHICEPSTDELLGDLLPRKSSMCRFTALLETSTSEHAARMMAMDNATKACNDMMEKPDSWLTTKPGRQPLRPI
jgi:F-type H+-transporting ATPase subunit gamma